MILRVMSYNIFEGGEGRVDPIAEVIRQADPHLVIVEETWNDEAFAMLARRLGMQEFQAAARDNPHGNVGLLSKLPIVEAVNHSFLDNRFERGIFHAVVDADGLHVPLVGLHLKAGATDADEKRRMGQLPAILDIAQRFAGRPHLLAGDFNSSHPQQVVEKSRLRPRTAREVASNPGGDLPRGVVGAMLTAGYTDAHVMGRQPDDFDVTFTTHEPSLRYDYIFASAELAPAVAACGTLYSSLAKYASDHYPVMATLDLSRCAPASAAGAAHEAPGPH